MNTEAKPSIYSYTNYRSFLKDSFDWRKAHGEYSYSVFAEHAGLKSRSYLRLVISGKRNLTADSIPKFVTAFELTGGESEAFAALVNFNQAGTHTSQKHYWDQFSNMRPKDQAQQRVQDLYTYLTKAMYPILLILLRQEHVAHDVASLSKMTGLSIDEINEGIRAFTNIGFLIRESGKKLTVASPSFETGNDVLNVAIPTFHQNMLKQALKATELSQDKREFQCTMMPLDEAEFQYLKKRLRDFADEMDALFGRGSRPKSNCVYALNLNLVPITPDFIRAEETQSVRQKTEKTDDLTEVTL